MTMMLLRMRRALVFAVFVALLAPLGAAAKIPGALSPALGSLPPQLILVPLCRQENVYTCGVAAAQSILCYYMDCDWRQDQLKRRLKATPENGTSYKAIQRFMEGRGYSVSVHTDMTLSDLQGLLDARKPTICLIQAWAGKPVDYATDWKDGHYVVAIGYDSKNIYFMDPSTLGNYTFIPTDEFLARWHDVDAIGGPRLNHFGMIVEKEGPRFDPGDVLPLG